MLDRLQYLADKAKSLPKAPGVYLMKDDKGRVIYVGKSDSLRDHVDSGRSFCDDRKAGPSRESQRQQSGGCAASMAAVL